MKSYHTDTINLLTNDDFDDLLIIADELFGRGYLSKDELQSYIDDKYTQKMHEQRFSRNHIHNQTCKQNVVQSHHYKRHEKDKRPYPE